MDRKTKRIVAATAGGLMLFGGGAALASAGLFDPDRTSREIIDAAAEELGISSDELSEALKSASVEQVDEALAEGSITEEQATRLKEAIESGDFPTVGGFGPWMGRGGPWGHGLMGFEVLDTAADYLGLTEAQVRTRLCNGRSLAEIAEAEGKSVDGLVDALVEAQKADLQDAVDDGRLTESQRDAILEGLEERVTSLVENELGPRGGGFGPHFGGRGPGW